MWIVNCRNVIAHRQKRRAARSREALLEVVRIVDCQVVEAAHEETADRTNAADEK